LTVDTQITADFSQSDWGRVPRSGLISEWLFEGNSDDTSGRGHHGIARGTVLSEDRFGRANAAYSFDGVGAYLSVPNHSDFNLIGDYAFSAWIYQKSAKPDGSFRILDKATAARCDGWNLDTWDGSTGRRIRLDVACPWSMSDTVYSLNEWHHVVASVSQGYVTFYLDGRIDGGGYISATPINSLDLYVGTAHSNSSLFFDGSIDDVRVYSRPLAPSEVGALYNDRERMYFDTVQKLYIGYYQRPADPGGLVFWENGLAQIDINHDGSFAGEDIISALSQFAYSDEARALCGGDITGSNIATVIDSIYSGLFGRHAEAEGLAWWVNSFSTGASTPATILWELMKGAQGTDAQTVQNRLAAASRFTRVVDSNLDDNLPFDRRYAGYDDCACARQWLAGVTFDDGTVPAEDQIRAFLPTPDSLTPMCSLH
jgi:hypothetical protein